MGSEYYEEKFKNHKKEFKDQFVSGIKKVLKKYNMKGTIKVRRYGYTPDLIVTLRKGPIDFEVDKSGGYDHLYASRENPPDINDDFKGLPKKFLKELHKEMMGGVWYDKSDWQTDYFNMSHGMEINIGASQDKPYVVTPDTTKVYEKYGKGMDSGRVGALVEGYHLKEDSLAYHEYKQRVREGENNLKVDGWALGDEHLILPLKKGYINHPVKNKLLEARGETVPDDSEYKKFPPVPSKAVTDKSLSKEAMEVDALMKQKKEIEKANKLAKGLKFPKPKKDNPKEIAKKLDNKSAENLAKKQKSLSKLETKLNSLKKQYEAEQKDYQRQLLDKMPKSKFKQSLMKPSMPVYKNGDVKVTLQSRNKKRLNKLFGRTYKRRK